MSPLVNFSVACESRQRCVRGILLLALLAIRVPEASGVDASINDKCKQLGRGINLGNALEAPAEGAWGMEVKAEYLRAIREAGFDSVRLPVKWSAHAEARAPFTIDAAFFTRVDEILDQCDALELNCVLNVHHYNELNDDPAGHGDRLVALWGQIASRYSARSDRLYFELNNEPHDKLDAAAWNTLIPRVLDKVRESNPTRPVIIGPHGYNGIWALPQLTLPDDPNLIVTVHNYEPFEFTHQGATWATEEVKHIRDREWNGTEPELKELRDRLDQAAAWSAANKRPIYLGEFGAYGAAAMESRVRWTTAMAREAEARGFSWAYWEFGSGFGAFDRERNAWREPLLKALVPDAVR